MPPHELVAVLGADSPIGLTVIRELGRHGVPVLALGGSALSLGRHSRYTRKFATIGKPLADWLPSFVAEHRVSAIMAISEHHLIELAKLAPQLVGCKVLSPASEQLALVLDKRRTLEFAETLGMSVPDSWQPVPDSDFAAKAASLHYPVAVKWPSPPDILDQLNAAGIAFEKVDYATDASQLLQILGRYDRLNQWPLVQTWCPGFGLGQMLMMQDGKATLRFQHQRLREWPPTGGVSSLARSLPLDRHAEQMQRSEALLAAMDWSGPAMVEYRYDPQTHRYWLMEVNGRFWGSLPLASSCGAEFAWEYYRRFGREDRTDREARSRDGRSRFVAPDVKHLWVQLTNKSASLSQKLRLSAQFLGEFFNPKTRYYVWSADDPKPFFGDLIDSTRRRSRKGKS
ncbi:carboxylate--amine ligase [Novosphingobium aquimarinum]|uniref:carboxylate--amine ligase n=1 Tax=Novosphingobium aquimarinum TaxID=2682494 RepID=UPI0012EB248F|nr:carboxylate--amine ligase [Novosphingobium aquimarinum]